jgi:hypothetical protein
MPETYSRMIKSIAENPQDLIAFGRIIRWLLFWGLPLSLCQLGVLATIRPPEVYTPGEDYSPHDIVEICVSFIKVVDLDGQNESVQVAHFSVTEYFLTQTFPGGTFNPDFISREDGHGVLLASCLTYLSSFRYDWRHALPVESDWDSDSDSDSDKPGESGVYYNIIPVDAFQRDCTTGVHDVAGRWPRIARVVERHPNSCQTIVLFLTTSPAFTSWACYCRYDFPVPGRRLVAPDKHCFREHNPLYYAARNGLPQVVKRLLLDATDVNPTGISDCLFRASIGVESRSQPATFSLFEAAFNATEVAALMGDFEVMNVLTTGGGKFGKNLLSRVMEEALLWDNPDYMSSLLSLKKYIKDEHCVVIDDSSTQSLIYTAVAQGRYDATKSLLNEADVDVNSRLPETQDTLLHLASGGRSSLSDTPSIAELLIAKGADIWAKGRFGWRPIEAAAFRHDVKCFESLRRRMYPGATIQVGWVRNVERRQTFSLIYKQLYELEPEVSIWQEIMGNLNLMSDDLRRALEFLSQSTSTVFTS